MNFINGITILLFYQLLGEVGVRALNLSLPGPVLGMGLLFLTLLFSGKKSPSLDAASGSILSHLSLLFVPAGVGLMVHLERFQAAWLPILLTLFLSTILTLAATAFAMQFVVRLSARRTQDHG